MGSFSQRHVMREFMGYQLGHLLRQREVIGEQRPKQPRYLHGRLSPSLSSTAHQRPHDRIELFVIGLKNSQDPGPEQDDLVPLAGVGITR
jgi:hypothetical protein